MRMPAPDLTIAIIHHALRGYPEACAESLAPLPAGTELLLVQTEPAASPEQHRGALAEARVISVRPEFSRAAAKNLAVAEARGEQLLLATADTTASPATVERLRRFLGEPSASGGRVVVSARLLQENGMPRRTGFGLPSIARELNPAGWLRRWRFPARARKPPAAGPARRAEALHATFLMARRETFRSVGGFAEGYRFAFEDLEWSWRARRQGVALCFCPDAPAHKLAPQLKGALSPEQRVALEASRLRCVRATRGKAYAQAFRATRAAKSLALWLAAAGLYRLFRAEEILANRAAVHRAIWEMRADAPPGADLPADLESRVRWEKLV
jgi:GT2 family glycosyltransferase